MQFNYVPTLRAQHALSRYDSSTAVDALQASAAYELESPCAGGTSFAPRRRIVTDLEGFHAMRFQTVGTSDAGAHWLR